MPNSCVIDCVNCGSTNALAVSVFATMALFYTNALAFAIVLLCRLFPKKVELQALMKHYDVDGDGSITYDEFLRGLR